MTAKELAERLENRSRHDLFRRALEGDPACLDDLMTSFVGYLTMLSQLHLDKRIQHRVSPSDIVQETLLDAHRDFANFHGDDLEEFIGWLRQVLVHNVANAVGVHVLAAKRSVRREQFLGSLSDSPDASHGGLYALPGPPQRSPASEADHQESIGQLKIAVEHLPEDYRTVIVLRHLEGLSFEEVADRMQRSTGATRMLWLRAIEQLRSIMEMPL